jgi:four helix bundle protein
MIKQFPWRMDARVVGQQLARAATSIGANLSEASAARSKTEFCSTLNISLKEGQEARYWIQLAIETDLIKEHEGRLLLAELTEILNIIASIIIKTRKNSGL